MILLKQERSLVVSRHKICKDCRMCNKEYLESHGLRRNVDENNHPTEYCAIPIDDCIHHKQNPKHDIEMADGLLPPPEGDGYFIVKLKNNTFMAVSIGCYTPDGYPYYFRDGSSLRVGDSILDEVVAWAKLPFAAFR